MNPTALTDMVDRVFADRYRLEALISAGPIFAVFRGIDTVEDRPVAIKVFSEAVSESERYVERLIEATEQAALLQHANIVEIYDWGVEGGPYIVSELCEGGSLAALIEEGHVLDASQALVMALECARALNHGHEQGSIHRGLTPDTVLFTDDQRVKIADYGLSEVLADAPSSHPNRALEKVRYASPEQARGRPVDESSDLYALALVVNEAVTGQRPHVADTVVGTLMERAESPADLDDRLGGLLPPLARCGRVDPAERPEAEELAIALLAAAETMPRPTAFPLVGLDLGDRKIDSEILVVGGVPGEPAPPPDRAADPISLSGEAPLEATTVEDDSDSVDPAVKAADGSDHDVTAHRAAAEAPAEDDDFDIAVLDQLGDLDDLDGFGATEEDGPIGNLELVADQPGVGGLENLEQAEPVFATVPEIDVETESTLDVPERSPIRPGVPAFEAQEDDADDRLPWWPLLLLVALIAAAVGAGVYFLTLSPSSEAAEVPELIGVQYDAVDELVGDRGWVVERLETRVDGSVPGSIVAQDPIAGTTLDEDDVLTVTVSLGNAMVEIPSDIVGLSVEQAASRLGGVGLTVGRLSEENNEQLAAGLVVGLDEPTTQKPSGEGVDLRVSAGPEDRVVPDNVVGMTIGDATSLLVGLRLQAVEEPAFDPELEVGTVLASIPPAGEIVPADSAVVLIVSAGPEPVEMPDIVGLQLDEAIDAIEELGLIFIDTTGTPGEAVIGSLPPIGAVVDVGTEVTIILDDPPDEEEEADE